MLNVQRLEQRLRLPLPGVPAHNTMAPHPPLPGTPGKSRFAAVLVLLSPIGHYLPNSISDLFVTLIRRADSTHHSGQIAFPGGMHEGTETLPDTALREAREEIGVSGEDVHLLGALTPVRTSTSHTVILPVLGLARSSPHFHANGEVASLIHVPLHALMSEDSRGVDIVRHPKTGRRRIPYFKIESAKLWGASAKIMAELLAVVSAVEPITEPAPLVQRPSPKVTQEDYRGGLLFCQSRMPASRS